MTKIHPLTVEESEYASLHIDLVYRYLHLKRLPEDEYFDVAVFGYLRAVQKQFRNPCEQEHENFTTLANICMKYAVIDEWRRQHAKKRRGDIVSLDCIPVPDSADGELSLYELLPDPRQDTFRQAEAKVFWAQLHQRGRQRELEAMNLIAAGFTVSEAAEYMHISPRKCRSLLRRIHKSINNRKEAFS